MHVTKTIHTVSSVDVLPTPPDERAWPERRSVHSPTSISPGGERPPTHRRVSELRESEVLRQAHEALRNAAPKTFELKLPAEARAKVEAATPPTRLQRAKAWVVSKLRRHRAPEAK